jgi:hypothetical protein
LDQTETARNKVLVAMLTENGARVKALMARVDLAPLLASRAKLNARTKEATAHNPEAAKLRGRAEEMAKKTITRELLESRQALDTAIKRFASAR